MSSLFFAQVPRDGFPRRRSSPAAPGRDFHGAALVDEQGREIPITEAMILRACRALEQDWHYPPRAVRTAG